jgi:pyruvate carboxylase
LLPRWQEVKHAFAIVNQLVGDIPKVTPSSKMVGDFAVFVVQNELLALVPGDFDASVERTRQNVIEHARHIDFPESVVQYFRGEIGHPPGGFPDDLRRAVLKGQPFVEDRPGAGLAPLDLDELQDRLSARLGEKIQPHEAISHALYPRVLDDHFEFRHRCGDVSVLSSSAYFYGLEPGREIWVQIEEGKTLVLELSAVSDPNDEGTRTAYFLLNGQSRQVTVQDRSLGAPRESGGRKADPAAPGEVGAPMPGTVIALQAEVGEAVEAGDPLVTLAAMKMETIVRAPVSGTVVELLPKVKDAVAAGDLLAVLTAAG